MTLRLTPVGGRGMTTSARVGAGELASSNDPCVCGGGGATVEYSGGGPKM